MATYGAITFDGVVGVIVPNTTKTVAPLDNAAQVQAAERRDGSFQPSSLAYNGYFSATQKAALYATVGTTLTAEDETGATATVLVVGMTVHEVPSRSADGLSTGVWCEATATVQAWA
jgi:hypothetical protein